MLSTIRDSGSMSNIDLNQLAGKEYRTDANLLPSARAERPNASRSCPGDDHHAMCYRIDVRSIRRHRHTSEYPR
jgi:hypothetical protein